MLGKERWDALFELMDAVLSDEKVSSRSTRSPRGPQGHVQRKRRALGHVDVKPRTAYPSKIDHTTNLLPFSLPLPFAARDGASLSRVAVLDAVMRGDGELAAILMEEHLLYGKRFLVAR